MYLHVTPLYAVLAVLTQLSILLAILAVLVYAARRRRRALVAAVLLLAVLTVAARADDQQPVVSCYALIDGYCGTGPSACRTWWEWLCWMGGIIY